MHTLGSLDAQHVAPGVIFKSPFVVPVWSQNPEKCGLGFCAQTLGVPRRAKMVPMWLKAPKITENGTLNHRFSIKLSAILHKDNVLKVTGDKQKT